MAMTLDELVTQLRGAYGDQLVSVVLYGSAAGGEHVPKKSDYNVLVLLARIDASALAAASLVARAWHEAGNPPPMTMTMSEWQHSSDVFPMEYADIVDRHRVLHGVSPIEGIVVSTGDLRLQLEHQVMGKLLQLRQGMLIAGTDGKRQLELLEKSFSTIMVLFRAAIRLAGKSPDGDRAAIARAAGELAGFDATAFVRIAAHVRGDTKILPAEASAISSLYLSGVERLNTWLDSFSTQEGQP